MAHAKLSPSSAHRWLVCPGSLKHPPGPTSVYAEAGTHSHAVLERVLTGKAPLAGDIILGKPITSEQINQAIEVRDHLRQWAKLTVETEVRLEISKAFGLTPGTIFGTADVMAYSPTEIIILDAKFGFVPVEPKLNPQLYLYIAGAISELQATMGDFYTTPGFSITVIIAQPNWEGVMQFREHRMNLDEFYQWGVGIKPYLVRAAEDSPIIDATSEHACRYCPGRTNCAARLEAAYNMAVAEWRDEKSLHDLLPLVPKLRAICDDLESMATARLLSGQAVEGYKLVESKSIRKWADETEVMNQLLEHNIVLTSVTETKLLSPAKMEKVVGKEFMKSLPVIQPKGGPKLAPASDPRPALDNNQFTAKEVALLLKS